MVSPQRSREIASHAFGKGPDARARGWAGLCLAYHQARSSEVDAAEETLRRSHHFFGDAKDGRGSTVADVLQGYVDIVRGRSDDAIRKLERIAAEQATSAAIPPLDRFLVRHGLALAHARLGQLERVLQHHYANVVLLERCGSPPPLAVVLLNLSGTLGAIDDWDEAFATATWAVKRCEAMDNAVLRRRAEINLALTSRFRGRIEDSLALLARLRAEPMREPGSDFALFINSSEALAVHGDLEEAAGCLERARGLASRPDPHQMGNCEWIAGLIDARAGRAAAAIQHLENARQAVQDLKQIHIPILPRVVEQLATCYAQTGDHERAFATYKRFHEVYEARLGYTTRARSLGKQSRHGILSIETALREQRDAGAPATDELAEWARLNEALRRALSGAHDEAGIPSGWSAKAIARVSVEARELGIDAHEVGGLVASLKRKALPSNAEVAARRVQVLVLGRFEIRIDGEALRFGRKSPSRPLAVLKYLAAQGEHEPPESEVADALWPDQDGDVALRSLAVNLHRLRRLLGDPSTVSHHDRRIALDSRHVSCDALAFEQLLDRAAMTDDGEQRRRYTEQALALYRGDFLAGEDAQSWILPMRERFRARFITACASQGALLSASTRMHEARSFYARGLQVDSSVEELCLGLMSCSLALHQPSPGIAAYRDLERALALRRGARPAAAIQALYGELLKLVR